VTTIEVFSIGIEAAHIVNSLLHALKRRAKTTTTNLALVEAVSPTILG
jgi:hypothetical protein